MALIKLERQSASQNNSLSPEDQALYDRMQSKIEQKKQGGLSDEELLSKIERRSPSSKVIPTKRGNMDILNDVISQHTPDIYQMGGNIMPMMLRSNPYSAAISAVSGAGMRSIGSMARNVGRGENIDFGEAGDQFKSGLLGEMGGEVLGNVSSFLGKSAIPMAKRIIKSYIKPTGKMAEKSDEIAETILREKLTKGSMTQMLEKALPRMRNVLKEVDSIISKYGHKRATAKKALQYLDNLESKYLSGQADPDAAKIVRETKQKLIESYGLKEPVFGEVEKGAFVMGGETRSVTPKKNVVYKEQTADLGAGKMKISPEKKVTILQETKYRHEPYVKGSSKKVIEQTGEKLKKFKLSQIQTQKRGQYQNLAGKYEQETPSPEVTTRKEFARGQKETIEEKLPREPIKQKNEQVEKLLDVIEAISDRLPKDERNNLLGFVDSVLAGGAILSPKMTIPLVGRKILGSGKVRNFIARKLFKYSQKTPVRSAIYKSAPSKALISKTIQGLRQEE